MVKIRKSDYSSQMTEQRFFKKCEKTVKHGFYAGGRGIYSGRYMELFL